MTDTTKVAPMDASQKNSPLLSSTEGASTVMLDAAASTCFWNGKEFPEGALVECDGKTYECTYGRWSSVD